MQRRPPLPHAVPQRNIAHLEATACAHPAVNEDNPAVPIDHDSQAIQTPALVLQPNLAHAKSTTHDACIWRNQGSQPCRSRKVHFAACPSPGSGRYVRDYGKEWADHLFAAAAAAAAAAAIKHLQYLYAQTRYFERYVRYPHSVHTDARYEWYECN